MNNNFRKKVLRSIATFVLIISTWSAYLAGYNRGSKDALDWDFSAVIGGKVVPVGRGHDLMRSRQNLRLNGNVNIVSAPLDIPGKQR